MLELVQLVVTVQLALGLPLLLLEQVRQYLPLGMAAALLLLRAPMRQYLPLGPV